MVEKNLKDLASKASEKAKKLKAGAAKSCCGPERSPKVAAVAGIISVALLSALVGRRSK